MASKFSRLLAILQSALRSPDCRCRSKIGINARPTHCSNREEKEVWNLECGKESVGRTGVNISKVGTNKTVSQKTDSLTNKRHGY